ncbi:hypothetical protein LTR56_010493 [Elasticomyces elasticus]|nr:hypothetical protein LTR56_010493 [Elasticomyces elasticus]KAK3657909.1 hypothetical protein LTR22_009136 [Elasticomyces elasticus]KAK4917596.1 hypothetical protein LTR49_014550 [Elasticomyces elasticus]KAK5762816.1 hypothetical protein LTS12_007005 [Elasticomyces elasticus]
MATTAPPQQQQPAGGLSRWVPSLPTINMNLITLNPFANAEEEKEKRPSSEQTRPKDDSKTASAKNRTFLSTFTTLLPTTTPTPPREPSPTRSNADSASIMFAEPDPSDDGSVQDAGRRASRLRSNKPKTSYSVCHPATASRARQSLHRKARSLLQLHRLAPGGRPVPAFEVVSSVSGDVRLTKAVTKVWRGRHAVCPNDFVVLRAEKYGGIEEEQAVRDIIGLICNRRKENKDEAVSSPDKPAKAPCSKICLASTGAEWEVCSLPTGGYEFFTTDSHGLGLKVRWVPKKEKDGSKATTKDGAQRFNFSTISANSRKHPVIATLSKRELEVYDTYKVFGDNTTPAATPSKRSSNPLVDAMAEEGEGEAEQDLQKETDEALREIITMTSIYVTFKEGWSPTFKYEEKEAIVNGSASKSALSLNNTASPPGSPTQVALEKRNSIKSISSGILRRSSLLGGGRAGNRASQASVPEGTEEGAYDPIGDSPSRSNSIKKTGRARGDSTSTVLVHRAASNRRKNTQAATWRPDLLQAQQRQEMRETSYENLSATPTPEVEREPRKQGQRQEAWESPDAVPTTPIEENGGIARPLIPDTVKSETVVPAVVAPMPPTLTPKTIAVSEQQRTLRPATPDEGKRISDATTTTMGSDAKTRYTGRSRTSKKKGGWRKLLCGGGNDI